MKFSIKDLFSKCDQIRRKYLLKKSLMENFIFCTVRYVKGSKIIRDFETLVMYAQQRNNRVKSNIFYTNIPKNELKFQIRNFHIDNV